MKPFGKNRIEFDCFYIKEVFKTLFYSEDIKDFKTFKTRLEFEHADYILQEILNFKRQVDCILEQDLYLDFGFENWTEFADAVRHKVKQLFKRRDWATDDI